jgi:hypothetical protein
MTPGRLAELRHWLKMCRDESIPELEWQSVVRQLLDAVEQLQAQLKEHALDPDILDCAAVAKMCGVAPRTVMMWCDNGRLRCEREGLTANRVIRRQDVIDFMHEHGFAFVENDL